MDKYASRRESCGPVAPRFVAFFVLLMAIGACTTARPPETATRAEIPPALAAEPPAPAPPPMLELPRGGRTIFPDYRLVGYCGTPGAPALGELQGDLVAKAKALQARAAAYDDDHKVLPVFELIAVVVLAIPGSDRKYRRRVDDAVVESYLREARRAKALLLLNIQPGQSDFLTEAKAFERYLREPDVGLALDPEWAMKAKQRPGVVWGQTTASDINAVAEYLSSLVAAGNLPEKALVFHEVVKEVVKDETSMRTSPGVVLVKSVDGLGSARAKAATYANLMGRTAPGVHPGFKLFFYEDTQHGSPLMSARQVLALSPKPEYVMYE
jgi:hypothetical protein